MENILKPELLSPAGNLEKMKFAYAFGADATYAGIPKFSLRTRENDFREQSLIEAIRYSKKLGKKLYLTLNIFAHNTKLNSFFKELDKIVEWEPDAIIMADPGLINQTLKRYPNLEIHLSTQANVTNWTTVEFWRDLGIKRIILSRELRLKEINEIHENVPDIELESFVHGAICIAYSGRCLISNYMNHRDANQGTCTNSCRWEYNLEESPSLLESEGQQIQAPINPEKELISGFTVEEVDKPGKKYPIEEDGEGTYLFNAKDLCAVELLNEIKSAGIMSFKIEGRTKSTYYSAITARAYRRAIDDMVQNKPFNHENLKDLLALSNRGYTTGFYTRNPQEYGENYDTGNSKEFYYKTVGIVRDYDNQKGLLNFEIKNRIETGSEVEIITPNDTIKMNVSHIQNMKEQLVPIAHGGLGEFKIPCEFDPGEFAVIRQKITN